MPATAIGGRKPFLLMGCQAAPMLKPAEACPAV